MLSIAFRGDQTGRQGRLIHVFLYNTDAQLTENYQGFIRFLLETIYRIWQQRSLSKLQIAPNFIKRQGLYIGKVSKMALVAVAIGPHKK